jgi:4-hydroxy-3-methylbut-2-enyl diphosphate reductase
MKIKLASNYGFCFGVKRAIKLAENLKDATTIGPLIHNNQEIQRLKNGFNVTTADSIHDIGNAHKTIIRTHGIEKNDLEELKKMDVEVVDATCPYVTKPQQIVEKMSQEGYTIVIFGDEEHPEVKGVKSYAGDNPYVVMNTKELDGINLGLKVAIVSQTTRKPSEFLKITNYLTMKVNEVRVFNTICNATFENQDAVKELAKESDIMIIVGGRSSSNTKQLLTISKESCKDSYLIESSKEIDEEWFKDKKVCGVSAGASTPDWIISEVTTKIGIITKK